MRKWPETTEVPSFYRYPVVAQGQVHGLCTHHDIFAVFNKTASQYMHQLVEMDGVRLEGLISRSQFLAARARNETTISVEVNVYGKREEACNVGDVLSRCGVYLQQPAYELEHTTYYNPHFLHIQELLGLGPAQETPKFKFGMPTDANVRQVGSNSLATPTTEPGDTSTEISNVLSSLTHHSILRQKAGAVSLRSELKELVALLPICAYTNARQRATTNLWRILGPATRWKDWTSFIGVRWEKYSRKLACGKKSQMTMESKCEDFGFIQDPPGG